MLSGGVKQRIQRFYIVNNHGFISVYGLVLFMISLVFVGMCTKQLQVQAKLKQTQELHVTEVFILQHVKHQMNDTKFAEDETSTYEEITFRSSTIQFSYESSKVFVAYVVGDRTYQMQISFHDGQILDVAYF